MNVLLVTHAACKESIAKIRTKQDSLIFTPLSCLSRAFPAALSILFYFFNSHLFPAGSEFSLEIREMKPIPLLLPVRLSDFTLQRSVPSICPPAQVCVMSLSRSHLSCCLLRVFTCEPEYGDVLYLNRLDPFPNGDAQPQTHKLSSFYFCVVLKFSTSTQLPTSQFIGNWWIHSRLQPKLLLFVWVTNTTLCLCTI